MGPFTRFRDIPQFTRDANYRISQPWEYLEDFLARMIDRGVHQTLNLDPDFQRAHVWDETKQIRYVEFILRGGKSGKEIYFNHPNWGGTYKGEMVLVDGKQRLEAVRRFLRNEIPAFGTLLSDYKDKLPFMQCDFLININNLRTRAEVLQWYIDLNAGGVAHTDEEIEKVRALLRQEGAE